jgi:hypothetical protein
VVCLIVITNNSYIFLQAPPNPPSTQGNNTVMGDKGDLESIGLDTKRLVNDLSDHGYSIDEKLMTFLLTKNLAHTGRIIELNPSVNDCTTLTMTSAITMETSMRAASKEAGTMLPPSDSVGNNNQEATVSREINGIQAFDPSAPGSPTTIAFYKNHPHLHSSEVDNSDVITTLQSNVPIAKDIIVLTVETREESLDVLANHDHTSTNINKEHQLRTIPEEQSKASTEKTMKV